MSLPWLTTIGLLPTIGAAVIWGSLLTGSRERAADLARWTALVVSVVVLALSVVLAIRFDVSRAAQFQFAETHSWIPQFGVSYALGVDGAVRGAAAAIGGLAGRWRRWQTGFVRSYAMSMLAGVLVVALGVLVVQL